MVKIVILFITVYQKLFSPDHSFWAKTKYPYGYCRYHPSCSEYCKQALAEEGLLKGGSKGLWRVLRCNPFSQGGFDPVTQVEKGN